MYQLRQAALTAVVGTVARDVLRNDDDLLDAQIGKLLRLVKDALPPAAAVLAA